MYSYHFFFSFPSCLLFIIVASESTKKPENSNSQQPSEHHKSLANNNVNVKINTIKSSSHVNTKENEIRKVNLNKNPGKSDKKPVLGRENVSITEEKCVKEMPNTAKNEQNKFFDAGDVARMTHDVVFLNAASKNSGVIQNE